MNSLQHPVVQRYNRHWALRHWLNQEPISSAKERPPTTTIENSDVLNSNIDLPYRTVATVLVVRLIVCFCGCCFITVIRSWRSFFPKLILTFENTALNLMAQGSPHPWFPYSLWAVWGLHISPHSYSKVFIVLLRMSAVRRILRQSSQQALGRGGA